VGHGLGWHELVLVEASATPWCIAGRSPGPSRVSPRLGRTTCPSSSASVCGWRVQRMSTGADTGNAVAVLADRSLSGVAVTVG